MIEVEGMEFKVLMGTDPAEVEEWRNQRRKKFPTKANLEQKEKSRQELLDAGGIEKQFSKQGKRRSDSKRTREEINPSSDTGQKRVKEDLSDDAGQSETILQLVHDYGSGESDIEVDEEKKDSGDLNSQPDIVRKPVPCRLYLAGKCRKGDKCKYSHSAAADNTAPTASSQPCAYFLKGKCRRGNRCMYSHSQPATSQSEANPSSSSTLSLYRKLLDNEIHEEENLVLQCIRFLVQENFLET